MQSLGPPAGLTCENLLLTGPSVGTTRSRVSRHRGPLRESKRGSFQGCLIQEVSSCTKIICCQISELLLSKSVLIPRCFLHLSSLCRAQATSLSAKKVSWPLHSLAPLREPKSRASARVTSGRQAVALRPSHLRGSLLRTGRVLPAAPAGLRRKQMSRYPHAGRRTNTWGKCQGQGGQMDAEIQWSPQRLQACRGPSFLHPPVVGWGLPRVPKRDAPSTRRLIQGHMREGSA